MKEYILTELEAQIIRDALIEARQALRVARSLDSELSPRGRKIRDALDALTEQFKTDCHNWKG